MGKIEEVGKRRAKRNELRRIILETVHTAGLIADGLLFTRTIGQSLAKLNVLHSPRRKDIIYRARNRLIAGGYLRFDHDGRMQLTQKGAKALEMMRQRESTDAKPRHWDHRWRVLVFDIPEKRADVRQRVRNNLMRIGFFRLQNSVWIYPYQCEELVALLKTELRVGRDMLYMVVESLENEHEVKARFDLQ